MDKKLVDIVATYSTAVSRLPALSEADIVEFEKRLPGNLPDDVRELLMYCSGFECATGEVVRLTGAGDVGFGQVIPFALAVMADGFGNFWVVDVDAQGAWGVVFYISHDPPVLAVQADNLQDFLEQVRDLCVHGVHRMTDFVRNEAVTRIWKDDPFVIPVPAARDARDAVVAKFAA